MRQLAIISLLSLLTLAIGTQALSQNCERLQQATLDELVTYLQSSEGDPSNAECVTFAIYRLGDTRYSPAIPELVTLLGFRRPLDEHEKLGYHIRMRDYYPAVDALQQIGEPASSAVLHAITEDSTPQVARKNAVIVWMGIHRNEPEKAVLALKRARDGATEQSTKEHLTRAMTQALQWCSPQDKQKCDLAAKESQ
ncbi:MAG TPA: hypothetical protein VKW78_19390 [Terriglobales bacterium]|nr:hypothetical protein [Terriglobales bacterium]